VLILVAAPAEGQLTAGICPSPSEGSEPMSETIRTSTRHAVAHRWHWRNFVRVLLLVTFCLSTLLSVISVWMHNQIADTDRYVTTVAPLASDPDIQNAIADSVSTRLEIWLNEHVSTRDLLIDRQQVLAAPLSAALVDYVDKTVREYVASDQFRQQWEQINRAVHPAVSAVLTGGRTEFVVADTGTISLDLAPVVNAVIERLNENGVTVFDQLQVDQLDTTFVIFESDELAQVQGLVDRLESLAIAFPILALLTLCGFVWLTPRRRQAIILAGVSLATTMAIALLLFAVARWRLLDQFDSDSSRRAAEAYLDIIARVPRQAARVLAAIALIVGGVAAATRPESRIRRAPVAARGWLTSTWRGIGTKLPWLQHGLHTATSHRRSLLIALFALFSLILITGDRVTPTPATLAVLVLAVGIAAILFMHTIEPQPVSAAAVAMTPAIVSVPLAPDGTGRSAPEREDASPPPPENQPVAPSDGMRSPSITISLELPDEDVKILRRLAVLLRESD
jgi:hypothetical protein